MCGIKLSRLFQNQHSKENGSCLRCIKLENERNDIPNVTRLTKMNNFEMKITLPNEFCFTGQSHSHFAKSISKQFHGQN